MVEGDICASYRKDLQFDAVGALWIWVSAGHAVTGGLAKVVNFLNVTLNKSGIELISGSLKANCSEESYEDAKRGFDEAVFHEAFILSIPAKDCLIDEQ